MIEYPPMPTVKTTVYGLGGMTGILLAAGAFAYPAVEHFKTERSYEKNVELHRKQDNESPLLELDPKIAARLRQLNLLDIVTGGQTRTAGNFGLRDSVLNGQIPYAYVDDVLKLNDWFENHHPLVEAYFQCKNGREGCPLLNEKDAKGQYKIDLSKSILQQLIKPEYSNVEKATTFAKARSVLDTLQTSVGSHFQESNLQAMEQWLKLNHDKAQKYLNSLNSQERKEKFAVLDEYVPDLSKFSFDEFFEKYKDQPKKDVVATENAFYKVVMNFYTLKEKVTPQTT